MSSFVLFFIIASVLCFIVLTAYKAWRYSHYPIHARLELYPVPKEGKGRAAYGGSYFEETEWWEKPRTLDNANETKDILGEMLFIHKLFVHQRSLWWASYAFHLGIYFMAAWTVLLLLAGIWPLAWLEVLAVVVGALGFGLSTLGAVLLLIRRVTDVTLRNFTTPQEYFNLALILFVLVTGIISWLFVASPFVVAMVVLQGVQVPLPPLVVVHVISFGLMLIYIPVSKMSHYVGKFFAFHKVLWDNDPNTQGSAVNARLKKSNDEPVRVTWQAPHASPERPTDPSADTPE